MPGPSVYSSAMQVNAPPALLQRIGRLLRAKESLVFYAIGLALLDFAAPLATGWLFRHRALATLLGTGNTVAGDAVAGHGAAVVAVAVAYLVVSAFLTAGYLRSLLGRLHWGPCDGRQFVRLFALLVLIAGVSWGLAALQGLVSGGNATLALFVVVVQMIVNVPLLYAEYATVVSNVGPGRAIWRSLRAFAANPLVSLLVLYCLFLVSFVLWQFLPGDKGAALSLAPTMLIHVLVWGCVSFLADVVLLSVYIDTIERGTLPPN